MIIATTNNSNSTWYTEEDISIFSSLTQENHTIKSYIIIDSFIDIDPFYYSLNAAFDNFDYSIKNEFSHYKKWWDWFRTGDFQQPCKKKKIIKTKNKHNKNYWRRILPSKSGWVGKVMQKRKGL